MSVEMCPTGTMPSCMDDVILPRAHDIGGFEVRRALPATQRQMVGPVIFFDQMGPGEFLTGRGLDVRPHPHIGLSTVTYLFDGAIQHRDSLGSDQSIVPGDVNWMTAGRGITHSERTAGPARTHTNRLFGIQSWVALPKQQEEIKPAFVHHDAAVLPVIEGGGTTLRLVAGRGWGLSSPVWTPSELFYADAELAADGALPMPDDHEERSAYVVTGEVAVAGVRFEAGRMLLFRAGDRVSVRAGSKGARLLLLGGAVMDGRAICFGTLFLHRESELHRQKTIGKPGVSPPCRATTRSSSRCRSNRWRPSRLCRHRPQAQRPADLCCHLRPHRGWKHGSSIPEQAVQLSRSRSIGPDECRLVRVVCARLRLPAAFRGFSGICQRLGRPQS